MPVFKCNVCDLLKSNLYKCTSCSLKYCSVNCCKVHKETCFIDSSLKNNCSEKAECPFSNKVRPNFECTLNEEHLEKIRNNEEIKEIIQSDKQLQAIFKEIHSLDEPNEFIEECLHNPSFVNLIDKYFNLLKTE